MLKTIDLESHYYDPAFIQVLIDRSRLRNYPFYDQENDTIYLSEKIIVKQGGVLKYLANAMEKRVSLMDKWGVDVSVISSSPGIEELPIETSIKVCKLSNQNIHAITQKYPARFRGSATLPVGDISAACEELERCVKEYGFVGWQAHSNFGLKTPDHPSFKPIFEKCAELGVYVYLHPHYLFGERFERFGFALAGAGLGFTVDTMTSILSLILSGIFDDYPDLKVVLGHLGEAIPFLLERIDSRMAFTPKEQVKNKHNVRYYFKNNIWVTTSGNLSKEAFKCTSDVLGLDHILLGTDYPYENYNETMSFIENLPLGYDDRAKLYGQNAIEYLNLVF